MKRLFLTILFLATFLSPAFSQSEDPTKGWDGFERCFTPEGRKDWRFEPDLSGELLIYASRVDLNLGIRMDRRRTWGIGIGLGDNYYDAEPSSEKYLSLYIHNRHYYPLGKRRKTSIFTEFTIGGAYIFYNSRNDEVVREKEEGIYKWSNPEGSVLFDMNLRAGFEFPIWRLHAYLGPAVQLAPFDSFGLCLGVFFQ